MELIIAIVFGVFFVGLAIVEIVDDVLTAKWKKDVTKDNAPDATPSMQQTDEVERLGKKRKARLEKAKAIALLVLIASQLFTIVLGAAEAQRSQEVKNAMSKLPVPGQDSHSPPTLGESIDHALAQLKGARDDIAAARADISRQADEARGMRQRIARIERFLWGGGDDDGDGPATPPGTPPEGDVLKELQHQRNQNAEMQKTINWLHQKVHGVMEMLKMPIDAPEAPALQEQREGELTH